MEGFDPFKPQAFNVEIGAPEIADEQPRGAPVFEPQIPVVEIVSMQADPDFYVSRVPGGVKA